MAGTTVVGMAPEEKSAVPTGLLPEPKPSQRHQTVSRGPQTSTLTLTCSVTSVAAKAGQQGGWASPDPSPCLLSSCAHWWGGAWPAPHQGRADSRGWLLCSTTAGGPNPRQSGRQEWPAGQWPLKAHGIPLSGACEAASAGQCGACPCRSGSLRAVDR